jgi:hypothetical protein
MINVSSYEYYLHQDTGYYDAYFHNIGEPIKVSYTEYLHSKARGYVATKVDRGTLIRDVHIQAQIEAGAHPSSYKVEQLKKAYDEKEKLVC